MWPALRVFIHMTGYRVCRPTGFGATALFLTFGLFLLVTAVAGCAALQDQLRKNPHVPLVTVEKVTVTPETVKPGTPIRATAPVVVVPQDPGGRVDVRYRWQMRYGASAPPRVLYETHDVFAEGVRVLSVETPVGADWPEGFYEITLTVDAPDGQRSGHVFLEVRRPPEPGEEWTTPPTARPKHD